MRYLIGLSTALLLVENKKVTKLEGGCFYGITFDQNYIYAFSRSGGAKVHIYDKNINKVCVKKVQASHLHQSLYDPVTDRVYITNTGSNQLTSYNTEFQDKKDYRWANSSKDVNHLNSIFRYGNHLYVYEHDLKGQNKQRGNGGVRRLTKDFKSDKVWRIADQGHNIWIENNFIYVCDSFNRKLVRRPLNDKYEFPCETLLSTEKYGQFGVRGLAIGNDKLLVGLSKWLQRDKRQSKHTGYILYYDRDYNLIDDLFLNEGQVFEIRLLDEIDHAHNGIIFNG